MSKILGYTNKPVIWIVLNDEVLKDNKVSPLYKTANPDGGTKSSCIWQQRSYCTLLLYET